MKHQRASKWLGGILLFLLGGMLVLWPDKDVPPQSEPWTKADDVVPVAGPSLAPAPIPEPEPLPEAFAIPGVPFTVQAPLAQWQEPLFQDACEEASIIMVEAWVNGGVLTKEGVTDEVKKLSKFEMEPFGQAIDTSITDTAWLLDQYYGIAGAVRTDITVADIKAALVDSNIVVVPTDGRKLKNPYFKQPGPSHHMLVITGYENKTAEFIVNDPGTRQGEGYRYPEVVLYEAILDYATGDHVPVTSTAKVMLTVSRD